MAMTVEECEAMLAASRESGKLLSIAYHYRYTDAAQVARSAVTNGDIGDPLVTRVQALRRRKVPGWGVFTNKELQGGGSLMDCGCFLVYLYVWLSDVTKSVVVMDGL